MGSKSTCTNLFSNCEQGCFHSNYVFIPTGVSHHRRLHSIITSHLIWSVLVLCSSRHPGSHFGNQCIVKYPDNKSGMIMFIKLTLLLGPAFSFTRNFMSNACVPIHQGCTLPSLLIIWLNHHKQGTCLEHICLHFKMELNLSSCLCIVIREYWLKSTTSACRTYS